MSKELEALERIKNYLSPVKIEETDIIENALKNYNDLQIDFKDHEDRLYNLTIEKEKQDEILRIIKEKKVNAGAMIESWKSFPFTYQHYLDYKDNYSFETLTEEEFDLLKEVLK